MAYVHFYTLLRQAMGDLIPEIDENQMPKLISKAGWLGVPIEGENNLQDVRDRNGPNMFFSIREQDIHIGISFNELPKVRVFFNILHEFHTPEKSKLVSYLTQLGPEFITTLYRKTKENYWGQSPDFTPELEFTTKEITIDKLEQFREQAKIILKEGRQRMTEQEKSHPIYTPSIDLSNVVVDKDDSSFFKAMKQLAPVYEISLLLKTDKEIKEELIKAENRKKAENMNWYTCPVCNSRYSREQRETTMFCSCGTSRATWKQG